jgi:hypothetical protein
MTEPNTDKAKSLCKESWLLFSKTVSHLETLQRLEKKIDKMFKLTKFCSYGAGFAIALCIIPGINSLVPLTISIFCLAGNICCMAAHYYLNRKWKKTTTIIDNLFLQLADKGELDERTTKEIRTVCN